MGRAPRWARGLLVALVTSAFGVALALTPLGQSFEKNVGLWWLFKLRGAIEPPAEAVVVGIDGATGRTLGLPKLPRDWPRTTHAQLIEALVEHGASVIVFDVDFNRPKSGYEDNVFANAIARADRVVLFEPLIGRRLPIERVDGTTGGWTWVEQKLEPSPQLALAAKALGPFPLPRTGQAAFQFWAFKSSVGDAPTTAAIALQLHALAIYERWLAVLRAAGAAGLEELPPRADQIRKAADLRHVMEVLRGVFLDDPELAGRIRAQLTADGVDLAPGDRRLISALATLYGSVEHRFLNLYGPPGTIRTVPYHHVIQQDNDAPELGDLQNKVVFVGYSDLYDPDQPDHFYTVFTGSDGVDLSGVEIMATAFANLLTGRTVEPSGTVLTVAVLALFGLIIGTIAYLLPATFAVPLVFLLTILFAAGAQWVFNQELRWLPLATPVLVQLPLALLFGLMGQYLFRRQREQQFSRAISYYLPENIVRDLTERNVDPDSVNRVVYGTCLATDMSGFSTISESKSPKELAIFMNAYFDALSQSLKRHAVDVTEFHADTIMCAWTAAEPKAEVRRNAVLAGIDVIQAIHEFSAQHGSLALNPRIGLQDGYFYLGHTGGGGRLAYSILGDTANTAARLESFNKHLGTHLLAAQSVVADVEDLLLVRPLGSFQFVGKTDPTPVVEILARKTAASADQRHLCERFAQALEAFCAQRWTEAAALFEALVERFAGDGPSRFYLSRCQHYAAEGPGEGDPTVIRLDAK